MREIIAYQCEHCRKIAKTAKTIEKHEQDCFCNPLNRACGSCDSKEQCFTKGKTACKDYSNFSLDDAGGAL